MLQPAICAKVAHPAKRGFDGLSGLVLNELGDNPTDGSVYVFLNRRRTHIKLLHWEAGGFVLYYKRLEKGCFPPPKNRNEKGGLSWTELVLMVEGIVVKKLKVPQGGEYSKSALFVEIMLIIST